MASPTPFLLLLLVYIVLMVSPVVKPLPEHDDELHLLHRHHRHPPRNQPPLPGPPSPTPPSPTPPIPPPSPPLPPCDCSCNCSHCGIEPPFMPAPPVAGRRGSRRGRPPVAVAPAPRPAFPVSPTDCVTPLAGLMSCGAFLTGRQPETPTPHSECCSGLGTFFNMSSAGGGDSLLRCLCPVILGDVNKMLPRPVDPVRLMFLPIACGVVLPPQVLYICFSGQPRVVPDSLGKGNDPPTLPVPEATMKNSYTSSSALFP